MVSDAAETDKGMSDPSNPVDAENFYVGEHITFQGRLGIVTSVNYTDTTTLVKVFVYEDVKTHVVNVEDENELYQIEEVS